ncbi:MAG: molybdenum cofactor biosynthesis protein MoaE [Candidatus Thermochlorobacter aerophilum]|uniref:Molybdopterin synthase catalytic subunit n=1 Tax=Candidatus Thermochlorobacter aerophilus TaxID=1868324 RepID=A0A395M136_9BACT|nr:MAG: molybdenum cofactor biosynthesis protein MoaE [Candidatus Thermochlorobacter aerophilum]
MRSQNTTELESLVLLRLTNEPIAIYEVLNAVRAPECGGLSLFVGTVRNHSGGRGNVLWLEYEAYESMALKKMREIAASVKQLYPVRKIAMVHRVGRLEIGDDAVAIAVSTPHRREAFAACKFVIDAVKATVPIWKKEVFADGEVWVDACAR